MVIILLLIWVPLGSVIAGGILRVGAKRMFKVEVALANALITVLLVQIAALVCGILLLQIATLIGGTAMVAPGIAGGSIPAWLVALLLVPNFLIQSAIVSRSLEISFQQACVVLAVTFAAWCGIGIGLGLMALIVGAALS